MRQRPRAKPVLFVVAMALLSCVDEKRATRPTKRRIALDPCHLVSPGVPARIEATCGSTEVPEDWARPAGKKIRLHVAVVPAVTDHPQPDPLFFFAGGPGEAASESFVGVAAAFKKVLRARDIVLVDQRGTGRSAALRCALPEDVNLYDELTDEQQDEWLCACVGSLKADLARYTTAAAVRDFDAVRARLGYTRVNLYGISYGTRVALSYLRRFPDQVRTVILDGVVPQDEVLGPTILSEGPKRTKEAMVQRCAADPSCSKHFPRLGRSFEVVEGKILAGLPAMEISHPRTGDSIEARLTWETWSLLLRISGYSSEMQALLPLLVHRAAKTKDLRPVLVRSIYVWDMLQRVIGNRVENTVLCTEDWPFFEKGGERNAPRRYGTREIASLERICELWPHEPASAEIKKPVVSAVAALILSGALDPVTPPSNGVIVARTLSNSLHVVVPGQGHGVVTRGCIPDQLSRFLETARPSAVDRACVARIKPVRFFVDLAGPEI